VLISIYRKVAISHGGLFEKIFKFHIPLLYMEAQGTDGKFILDGNKIKIVRKGFTAFMLHGLKGEKEILIKQISAIQMRNAGTYHEGYLRFSFLGSEAKSTAFDGQSNENSVRFTKAQQPDFEKIKLAIDKKMEDGESKSSLSGLDDLEKLAELKKKGIITAKEFTLKKKKILGI